MIQFDYYYRRRHLDGTTAIAISTGAALARCDDATALVVDYLLSAPSSYGPYPGRRGDRQTRIALRTEPVVATRLWLWRERALRLLQFFDEAGSCALYRIDFATPPRRSGHECYQTDLYLDLFVSADLADYAILDEDELEIARLSGLIDSAARAQILAETDRLVELLERGRFGEWLSATCSAPFELAQIVSGRSWRQRRFAASEADGWPEGSD